MYFHKKQGRNFECMCIKFLEVTHMTRRKRKPGFRFVLFSFLFQERNLRALGGCLSSAMTWSYSRNSSFLLMQKWTKACSILRGLHSPPPEDGVNRTDMRRSTGRKKGLWLPRSCPAGHRHAGAEQEKDLPDFTVWVNSSWVFDMGLVRTLNVIWF